MFYNKNILSHKKTRDVLQQKVSSFYNKFCFRKFAVLQEKKSAFVTKVSIL